MTLFQFATKTDLIRQKELDKVGLLAFFKSQTESVTEFTTTDIDGWFSDLALSRPNKSRLAANLKKSRNFIRGSHSKSFRLSARAIHDFKVLHPDIGERSEEVVSTETILPEPLYTKTRGYIESLARQINASYEHNIFDGCAVLMRRLLEVLLILSYEHYHIGSAIKDSNGNFLLLERIVADAKNNTTLQLSRNSRETLDVFRTLGNFSAHKIYYNAKRDDIRRVTVEFRALVEELLYKAGIRV